MPNSVVGKINFKLIFPDILALNAASLIEQTQKVNHWKFNIVIAFNYQIDCFGQTTPGTHILEINPDRCITKYKQAKTSFPYYVSDYSAFGVIIHEFAHFLALTFHKSISSKYRKAFPTERLMINDCKEPNEDVDEEIAEIMTLYIVNPYLLKLISEKHFNFFKKQFKSPTKCTEHQFIEYYQKFPSNLKKKLLLKWKILVDVNKNCVIREIPATS